MTTKARARQQLTQLRPRLERDGEQLEQDARELYQSLNELIRVYQFRDRDRICCYDLSVTQCYALEAVVTRGPLTMNDVAAQLYLDKSTASRVIDGLETKGFLRRKQHPEDRRALLLEPTASGKRLHERISADILEEETRLLGDFEPRVRQSMIRLISRLAEAAASRVSTQGGSCCRIE